MLSSCGFEALHGPHQVAEKQTRALALLDLKVFTADDESNSCNVIVGY
jgi:hypothetical protein